MIRPIFLTVLLVLTVLMSNAQVRIGPKVGSNLTNFVGDQEQFYTENSNYKFGFNGGFVANFPILKFLSVQTEFQYSQHGAIMNEEDFANVSPDWEVRTDMHYLQLPLLIKLAFGGEEFKFYLNGGGYGGYLAASEYNGADSDDFENVLNASFYPYLDDQYKDWDLGYTGGFGLQFTVNDEDHFLVDFRFSRSITSITDDVNDPTQPNTQIKQYNQAFSLSLTYLMSTGS